MRRAEQPVVKSGPPWRLALVLDVRASLPRAILKGVFRFVVADRQWQLNVVTQSARAVAEELARWKPDVIIGQVYSDSDVRMLRGVGVPVVNVSNSRGDLPFPRVINDDRASGAMAAREFLAAGFRHLAYVPFPGRHFSDLRLEGFAAEAAERGVRGISVYASDAVSGVEQWASQLGEWAQQLPKPVGVFCANDQKARTFVTACVSAGIAVPEAVSVIGVDDDDLQTASSPVPLSSVAIDAEAIGSRAAEMAFYLVRGDELKEQTVLVPPARVVRRRSSDAMAVGDVLVARAVQIIWERCGELDGVDGLLDILEPRVSRRQLELRFRAALSRAPMAEIRRARIERAKALLTQTRLAMSDVASRCGFANYKVLAMAFRHATGASPSQYRKQHSGGGAAR